MMNELNLWTYDECVKSAKYNALDKLFDITKVKGEWLSTEDKRLYHLQVESRGEVGYATSKTAGKETIHPSKRRKLSAKSSTVKSASCDLLSNDSDKESDKSELERKWVWKRWWGISLFTVIPNCFCWSLAPVFTFILSGIWKMIFGVDLALPWLLCLY